MKRGRDHREVEDRSVEEGTACPVTGECVPGSTPEIQAPPNRIERAKEYRETPSFQRSRRGPFERGGCRNSDQRRLLIAFYFVSKVVLCSLGAESE